MPLANLWTGPVYKYMLMLASLEDFHATAGLEGDRGELDLCRQGRDKQIRIQPLFQRIADVRQGNTWIIAVRAQQHRLHCPECYRVLFTGSPWFLKSLHYGLPCLELLGKRG